MNKKRKGIEMKKLLLVTILLILIGCGTTYYEKFQQECKQYKVSELLPLLEAGASWEVRVSRILCKLKI